ncbi:hypothetical protein SLA2020_498140 [Shorea laevis]
MRAEAEAEAVAEAQKNGTPMPVHGCILFCFLNLLILGKGVAGQILSKPKLEKCEKSTVAAGNLNCTNNEDRPQHFRSEWFSKHSPLPR